MTDMVHEMGRQGWGQRSYLNTLYDQEHIKNENMTKKDIEDMQGIFCGKGEVQSGNSVLCKRGGRQGGGKVLSHCQ